MSNGDRYLCDYSLPYGTTQVELNDSTLYQQQDPSPFDYTPTTHSFDSSIKSIVYTQLQGIDNTAMTDMVTASPGFACFPQHEPSFYSSQNSDMLGLCTTSAERTLPSSSSRSPMETDITNNANTNGTVIMTISNSDTTIASSPSCIWTPSDSPTSTRSASLNGTNGPLLLPQTLSTSLSYLSPSLSHVYYASNQDQPHDYHHQQHSMNHNQSNLSSCPSPMPINQKQPHSINSITSTLYDADTATPQSTTTSNDQISQRPTDMDSNECDTMPLGISQTQSNISAASNTELRRQIHIQSEQKRRAQIKDGFEDLRNELPASLHKKMSKVALLHRTVQHIQHLKNTQVSILNELERLMNENEHLRRFQKTTIQASGVSKE